MIITCINCNKIFDIDSALIPKNGRLLQCNSCNHKWFFKNESITKFIEPIKNDILEVFEPAEDIKSKDLDLDKDTINNEKINPSLVETSDKTLDKTSLNKKKKLKKRNFLNLLIVFVFSFVALIILTDTLKSPISKIFPDIEFFLYNLYETFKDITLFIKDLI